MRRTILYISDHFMKPIGLNSIASWIGVSASYLSRIFRQEVGKTLVDYVNWYRIEMSKQYMLAQNINLKEISGLVGFKNYNYFFTVFKEQEGQTPAEYVRSQKS